MKIWYRLGQTISILIISYGIFFPLRYLLIGGDHILRVILVFIIGGTLISLGIYLFKKVGNSYRKYLRYERKTNLNRRIRR